VRGHALPLNPGDIGMRDVSIIIVSYNTRELTLECLRSVYDQTRDVSFEVFVVDNASADGSAAVIAAEFPQVHLIANAENRGFAAAGRLDAWIVTLDGHDAAFQITTQAHKHRASFLIAFRLKYEAYSVGKWLTSRLLEDCCGAGVTELDFGQGDADYKRFWANDSHQIDRVFVGCGAIGTVAAVALTLAWRAMRVPFVRHAARRVRTTLQRKGRIS
jgi:GT2 family glycosyltransferase